MGNFLCVRCKKRPSMKHRKICTPCRNEESRINAGEIRKKDIDRIFLTCSTCKKPKKADHQRRCRNCLNKTTRKRRQAHIEDYKKYEKERRIYYRETLHDVYVKQLLSVTGTLPPSKVPKELIELKHAQITLLREIRRQVYG